MLRSKIKGTLSIISSYPPSKDVNARFTKMPLKPLFNLNKYVEDIVVFLD